MSQHIENREYVSKGTLMSVPRGVGTATDSTLTMQVLMDISEQQREQIKKDTEIAETLTSIQSLLLTLTEHLAPLV